MDISTALHGLYLSKDEITSPTPFTITGAEWVEFPGRNGEPDEKKVAITLNDEKKFTLNKTNLGILADAYGKDAAHWTDKPIVVINDPSVVFAGRRVGGLRVQLPADVIGTQISTE